MQKLQPFDLILFGGTGDLAMRKLMPALYRRVRAGQITAGSRIIAVARSNHTRVGFLAEVEAKCRPHLGEGEFAPEHWQAFVALVDYLSVNATVETDFGPSGREAQGERRSRARDVPVDGAESVYIHL
ncbi:MAG: hypothetical protein WDM77_11805 [Steroidobacteraceae bacterium]